MKKLSPKKGSLNFENCRYLYRKGIKMKNRAKILLVILSTVCLLSGCGNVVREGTKALGAEEYDKAVTAFQEAIDSGDQDKVAEGYQGLGMAYYEQKEYDKAEEAFQNALDKGAKQTIQLYNLAGISAMQNADYDKALEYIQAGLALKSDAETSKSEQSDTGKSEKKEKNSESSLIQEMKYNEIICLEKTADWDGAKSKMLEYQESYPDDTSVEKEAEFLQTR